MLTTLIPWLCAAFLALPSAHGVADATRPVSVARALTTENGAVACVDHFAARIGAEVLAEGGNAVDAAVAVGFALAVSHPAAGNLGGGGFMVIALADGRQATVDYREKAPAAAWPEMFLDENGDIDPNKAGIGHWVVGVPGTVAGLEKAHAIFGSLSWQRLVQPARRLAQDGIEVDQDLARGLAAHAEVFQRYPATARCFLHPDGSAYAVGEVLRQPDLANSLRWIEEGGSKAFYRGPIAALIDAEMRRAGALVTSADLAAYEPVVREPVRFEYRGFDLISMPPPSSGGITLGQILALVEPMELRKLGWGSAAARHLVAESQRRAFASRAVHLGDPEANDLDVERLLSEEYLAPLRASINPDRVTSSESMGPPLTVAEGSHTTHFSIVDARGNAVSNTYTLEQSYGSKVVAEGTGFLLNNELHDFNLKPGLTDRRGRIGTAPNLPRPGRRPLSSMTPTIVLKDGKPFLVTGSPGGRTIINTVTCVVLAVLEFGLGIDEAVAAPRQHHQWFPDQLSVESSLEEAVVTELKGLGHELKTKSLGDAHSIVIDPETGAARAVADRRIDGWVAAPRGQ